MSEFVGEHLGRARKALALADAFARVAEPRAGMLDSEAALRCALEAGDQEWNAIAELAQTRPPSTATRTAVIVILAARVVARAPLDPAA